MTRVVAPPGQIVIHARYALVDPAVPMLLRDARIVVEDGLVVSVGPRGAAGQVPTSVSRSFDLVMPGLINAHHHAYARSPAMAGCPDLPLEPWLVALNGVPDGGGAYLATLAASLRQLRAGVTSVLHSDGPGPAHAYEEMVRDRLRAYAESGQRVAFAVGYADQQAWVYAPDDVFLATLEPSARRRLLAHMHSVAGPSPAAYAALFAALWDTYAERDQPGTASQRLLLGPLSPLWASHEALEAMAPLLRRYPTTGLHTHFQESIYQRAWADKEYDGRLARHLAQLGLLDERTSLAHGVWPSQDDLDVLRETGATVVHNPASNLRLRSGVAPVLDLRARGIHVALGQDATGLDDDDDFLREARLAWRLHFRPGLDAPSLAARDVFQMIFHDGARAMGLLGQLGAIKAGARADLIGLGMDRLGLPAQDDADGVAHYVLQWLRGEDVRWVMVAGNDVVRDGRVLTVDEGAVLAAVEEAYAKLIETTEMRDLFRYVDQRVRDYYANAHPTSRDMHRNRATW
jgi:cytosine/adenosine deaminase-related metal-dependent hydrolase